MDRRHRRRRRRRRHRRCRWLLYPCEYIWGATIAHWHVGEAVFALGKHSSKDSLCFCIELDMVEPLVEV